MIAYAIDKFLKKGGEISFSKDKSLSAIPGTTNLNLKELRIFDGGKKLLSNILDTNMTGLTGSFLFNPDISLQNPCFDVINVLQTQSRLVGYWSNNSGLFVQTPESTFYTKPSKRSSSNQHLRSVVWPGNTKDKPRGWEFTNNGRPLRIGVPFRLKH